MSKSAAPKYVPPAAKIRKEDDAQAEIPNFHKGYAEMKDTLVTMSAKSRGVRCHSGPVKRTPALPPRDCMAWVREDKRHRPYSYFEMSNNSPAPLPKKSPPPPRLWLPNSSIQSVQSGKTGSLSFADASLMGSVATLSQGSIDRAPWDYEHHMTYSRRNHEFRKGMREYFDVPKDQDEDMKGLPVRVREKYVMNDRQLNWNDEPSDSVASRRTIWDHIADSKDAQLPSYWRKVKNWRVHSMPALPTEDTGLSGSRSPVAAERSLLEALADTPATQSKDFWRGWAQANAKAATSSPRRAGRKKWNNRWQVTESLCNEGMDHRTRDYFSVPRGKRGRATQSPKAR